MEGGHQGVGNGVWEKHRSAYRWCAFVVWSLQLPCTLVSVKALNLFEGSHNSVLMGDTSPYSWVYVT